MTRWVKNAREVERRERLVTFDEEGSNLFTRALAQLFGREVRGEVTINVSPAGRAVSARLIEAEREEK